jgi:hypothetical protein
VRARIGGAIALSIAVGCGGGASDPSGGTDDGSDAGSGPGEGDGGPPGDDGPTGDAGGDGDDGDDGNDSLDDDSGGVPCGELGERVTVTPIDVTATPQASPHDDTLGGWWTMGDIPPVITALEPDDEIRIAWRDDAGLVHVTPIDATGVPKGADATVAAAWLRGLVAHDDGAALLLARGECMAMDLVRLDDAGAEVFATTLTDEDDCHSSTHMGRLAWDGSVYAAYFGIHGTAGFSMGHEGDKLKMIDESGAIVDGGWEWGCSHSMDVQLASVGGQWVPLCISDCYPGQGIYVGNAAEISIETGNCAGETNARFGGMTELGGTMWLAYASLEGRAAFDVAIASFSPAGEVGSPKAWLTETPGDEANVKLARYGTGAMLASWSAGGMHVLQLLDSAGAPQGDPVSVDIDVGPLDDVHTTSTGDVVWAFADAAGGLSLGRVTYCE